MGQFDIGSVKLFAVVGYFLVSGIYFHELLRENLSSILLNQTLFCPFLCFVYWLGNHT
ncbi:hypothetical protein NVIRPANT_00300 [Pantoea sp. Nvir]|nr:hypothetical protein NVIRPANT_00300 [Pantoea sp. Nvir]